MNSPVYSIIHLASPRHRQRARTHCLITRLCRSHGGRISSKHRAADGTLPTSLAAERTPSLTYKHVTF